MSIRSLTVLAAARDKGTPTRAKRKAMTSNGGEPVEVVSGEETTVTAGEALVAAIPTEPLAIYTGLISAMVALFAEGSKSTEQYLPLRWWLFGGATVLVVIWVVGGYYSLGRPRTTKARAFPVAEVAAAAFAFGAWGLVMPESPLRTQLGGTTEGVVTLCITFGGAAIVYLMALLGLTKKARTR